MRSCCRARTQPSQRTTLSAPNARRAQRSHSPSRPSPGYLIAKAQIQQGRFAEASRASRGRWRSTPRNPNRGSDSATSRRREGRGEEAIQLYERVRPLPLVNPEAIWRSAALHLEAGRRERARELLAGIPQAVQRTPEAAERLARAELVAGRPDLALTRLGGALRDFAWVPPLWLLKADLLDQQGDIEGALAARRSALELAPDRPVIQNVVAWTLGRLGRNLAEAEALAQSAIGKLGRRPPLLDTLATVRGARRALGRLARARRRGAHRRHPTQSGGSVVPARRGARGPRA